MGKMYLLECIGTGGMRGVELVAKKKSTIVNYLKEKGYYYSKNLNRYIDDRYKNTGTDYVIYPVDVLKDK